MLFEEIVNRPTALDSDLEEQWEYKLRCEHRDHSTDSRFHLPTEPATVRGYAPCGKTMNICAKFAEAVARAGEVAMLCQCGAKHFASSFRFLEI